MRSNFRKQLVQAKSTAASCGVPSLVAMVREMEVVVEEQSIDAFIRTLTTSEVQELVGSNIGIGGGVHVERVANYLQPYFFKQQEQDMAAIDDALTSVRKLQTATMMLMYCQKYMQNQKVMHSLFQRDLVACLTAKPATKAPEQSAVGLKRFFGR